MDWSGRRLLVNFVTNANPRGRVPLRPERSPQGFQPPTDIYETAEALFVRMEIAGMTPEAIDLTIDEEAGRLTISGNRPDPAAGTPRRYFNVEIECGEFIRVVQLPRPVVVDEVEASYDRGFLLVRLPIRVQRAGEPRNVPIR